MINLSQYFFDIKQLFMLKFKEQKKPFLLGANPFMRSHRAGLAVHKSV